jgi:hypothetical protein
MLGGIREVLEAQQRREVSIMATKRGTIPKVIICELCRDAYQSEESDGMRQLKAFKGYTVDVRLLEFRKVHGRPDAHGPIEFVDFESAKGQRLLQQMHDAMLADLDKGREG